MRIIISTCFIFLQLTFLSCQTEARNNSLLVAEYQKESPDGRLQHLVSYNFKNGKLLSKDTIFSTPTFKNGKRLVSYDFGDNVIYKNRYVISGLGNVIDVKNRVLLEDTGDDFIDAIGDSLIFYRNNHNTGTGYLLADLKKWEYRFIQDNSFSVKGLHSPNHQLGLQIDYSELSYKIALYDKDNNKKIIVNDCGYGTLMSIKSSSMSDVPVYWIDNQNFLYALRGLNSGRKVLIYKTNIEKKSSEVVAEIDSVPPAVSNSFFSKDSEENIIFHCSKGEFAIDLMKNKAILSRMNTIGDDFSISWNRYKEFGHIIEFQNKEIGRVWCLYYTAKTTKGFLAVEYGDVNSNLGYPKGVKVWNNITKDWTDIEVNWLFDLIGWIEN